MNADDKKIAVLIDVENISHTYINKILDEVSLYGTPTYRRLYGDFTKPDLHPWNDKTNEYSLRQVQQGRFTKGKNSSDSILIIDAMDILYSGNVDSFCIVSNDSDFTALAMRIMESGYDVIGMGEDEQKAPKSFVNACTKFVYLKDEVAKSPVKVKKVKNKKSSQAKEVPDEVIDTIITAINNSDSDDDGWVRASVVGNVLYRRHPEFDPTLYGAPQKKLSSFLGLFDEFEIREVKSDKAKNSNVSEVFVRLKA